MTHSPASVIAKELGISRQAVYQQAAKLGINYIEPFRQMRVYDRKDWNKKVPNRQLSMESKG